LLTLVYSPFVAITLPPCDLALIACGMATAVYTEAVIIRREALAKAAK